jgi:hypothetical protein
MDYSVPEKVTEKFVSLMDNLGTLLARYGKVIISKKHVSLMLPSQIVAKSHVLE